MQKNIILILLGSFFLAGCLNTSYKVREKIIPPTKEQIELGITSGITEKTVDVRLYRSLTKTSFGELDIDVGATNKSVKISDYSSEVQEKALKVLTDGFSKTIAEVMKQLATGGIAP